MIKNQNITQSSHFKVHHFHWHLGPSHIFHEINVTKCRKMRNKGLWCSLKLSPWYIRSWTYPIRRPLTLQLQLYFLNMDCVSSRCVFSHRFVGHLSCRQYIGTYVDGKPAEQSQTTRMQVSVLYMWDLASHRADVLIKAKTLPGGISPPPPSANQWATLSFMVKLIGWWHSDSL